MEDNEETAIKIKDNLVAFTAHSRLLHQYEGITRSQVSYWGPSPDNYFSYYN